MSKPNPKPTVCPYLGHDISIERGIKCPYCESVREFGVLETEPKKPITDLLVAHGLIPETQPDTEQLIDEAIEGYKLDTDDEPDTKGGVQSVPTLEPDNKLIPVWRRLGENDPKPANGQWIQVATPGIYAFEFETVRIPEALSNLNAPKSAASDDAILEPDTAIDIDNIITTIAHRGEPVTRETRVAMRAAIREMITEAKISENQMYLDRIETFRNRVKVPGELTATSFGSAGAGMVEQAYEKSFNDRISELERNKQ